MPIYTARIKIDQIGFDCENPKEAKLAFIEYIKNNIDSIIILKEASSPKLSNTCSSVYTERIV